MTRIWKAACASLGLAATGLAQAPLYDFFSLTAGDRFGSSVIGLGDVDGDGFGDVAIGARGGDGLQPDSGVVRIYSGQDAHLIRELKGERTGDNFGFAIDVLGDINGDGVNDMIVGAPDHEPLGGTNRGAAYTFSGATGAQLSKINGGSDGDRAGYAVTGVPDVNLDGVPDYAFGEPWGDSGGLTDCGQVWVHSGTNHVSIRVYSGAAGFDHFGYAIDGLKDINGDGRGDLLIGAPQADAAGIFDSGRAYRCSGAASGSVLATISGSTSAGWLGHSVAALPDTTGDGLPETAVGEPFVSVGGVVGSGRIRVYSGSNGAVTLTLTGAQQEEYGWVLAGMEDFDGDGKGDLLLGVPGASYGGFADMGLAKVISGANGSLLTQMSGYYAGEGFGNAVGDAGDINGDGFHDVIAGSTAYNQYGVNAGRARTALGNAAFPTNYCTAKVNSQNCTPLIGIGGCASYTVGQLQIVGANVLPNVSGLMIWSHTSASTPFFGDTLCIGGPIRRTPVQLAIDNTGSVYPCDGVYSYVFTHAQMQAEGFTPGTHLFAQYWSRDPAFPPPFNFGLTNGVNIPILP